MGDACSNGVGACARPGSLFCSPEGRLACDAVPGAGHEELCNGLDDDCDGLTDEELPRGLPCDSGRPGVCAAGHQRCVDGAAACVSDAEPTAEACDGLDNDCNAQVDDGFGQVTCGVGVCRHTQDGCVDGVRSACDPLAGAGEELCNGLDDDCDGQVDDRPADANIPCEGGSGECRRIGAVRCVEGQRVCNAVPGEPTP